MALMQQASKPQVAVATEFVGDKKVGGADGLYRNGGKRILDVALVVISLPIVLPILLAMAVVVMADGGTPFYGQKRIGRGGRVFTCWKIRTMVPDADRKLVEHLAADEDARAEWDETQKLRHDPRITAFGRIVRPTSMDELPQVFNILIGDMSIVGPRPFTPDQKPLYPGQAYYKLRPGLTGFWQVGDRNDCSFAGRATHDARYSRRLSLWTDIVTIWKTVWVVFRGTGC